MGQLQRLHGELIDHQPLLPERRARVAPGFETDADYFARRAREQQAYAAGLFNPVTRDLHRELASRYAALAAAIKEADDRMG